MTSPTDDAVRHYLELPYRIELRRDATDDERPWRAIVEDLPGCEVRGTTPPDAVSRVPAVMAEWVASAQAAGCEVPEPRDVRAYSGKLLVRMPQSLHAEVALAAERDHVSINAYINSLLAADVHWRRPAEALPDPRRRSRRRGRRAGWASEPAVAGRVRQLRDDGRSRRRRRHPAAGGLIAARRSASVQAPRPERRTVPRPPTAPRGTV
jgi:predicted RNase H-like HicB family nuclease